MREAGPGHSSRSAAARIALVAFAGVIVATCSFDAAFSKELGPGLLPYLAGVSDVTHGRTPLVDAASRGGWGAIDALSVVFSSWSLGYGTLALTVSAAAAACALLVLILATLVVRPLGAALLVGTAAAVLGALGGPVPDAAAPSSGALTLLIPLFGAVGIVLGADRVRWRPVVSLSCLLAVMWSAPAAVLTIATVAAGIGGWPAEARRGQARSCALACGAGLVLYAVASLLRSGALPDPRVLLATEPLAPSPGDPAATLASAVLGCGTMLAVVLAWWMSRRDGLATRTGSRSVCAVRAVGALAATLGAHGLIAGAPVETAHAAGLAVLLVGIVAARRGLRGGAAVAVATVAFFALAGSTIADRWQTSALYAAIPHQPFDALPIGDDHFGQSLRYNLRLLSRRPLVAADAGIVLLPLMPAATRDGDRVLVVLPGAQQAEALAVLDSTSMLPLGDPTTDALVGTLHARLKEAIRNLPARPHIITREEWLGPLAVPNLTARGEPALQALRLLLQVFETRVVERAGTSGFVVAELQRR